MNDFYFVYWMDKTVVNEDIFFLNNFFSKNSD